MTKRLLPALLLLVTAPACLPKNESNSAVKFDEATNNELAKLDYTQAMKDFCKKTPIVFFVGDAEPIISVGASKFSSPETKVLLNEVNDSAFNLRNALRKMRPRCESVLRDAKKDDPRVLLVTIVDGHGSSDSKITTTWYNFDKNRRTVKGDDYSQGWDVQLDEYWKVEDGKIVKTDTKDLWELDLPGSIEMLVNHFLNAKPPQYEGDFKFDQTIYMFKAHGGKFFDANGAITANTHYKASVGKAPLELKGRAFLFDGHGPGRGQDGFLSSNLFIPVVYNTFDNCQLYGNATSAADPAPTPEMCAACETFFRQSSTRGAFAQCKDYGPVVSASGLTTGETSGATDEKGLGAAGETSLGAAGETSLGAAGETSLGAAGETSLGAAGETSLGAAGETSLGAAGETSLGAAGETSLGSGKGVIYNKRPADDDFQVVAQLGKAVVYGSSTPVEGSVSLNLPLRGGLESPAMVVLDSCYGANELATSSFHHEDGVTPYVTIYNENPMAIAGINYGALDYFGLIALPAVEVSVRTDPMRHKIVDDVREAIESHLNKNGLTQDKKGNTTAEEKSMHQIKIQVLRDKQVIDQIQKRAP